jgi:hypothetical protein
MHFMSMRSTLLLLAMLLVAPLAAPAVAPLQAIAEEPADASAVLKDDTPAASLGKRELRKRIKLLKQSIKSGNLPRAEQRERRKKMKEYRQELRARKGKTGKTGKSASPDETAPVESKQKKNRAASEPDETAKPEQSGIKPDQSQNKPEQPQLKPEKSPDGASGNAAPAQEAAPPKTDSSGSSGTAAPSTNVSVGDCNGLWNSANRNGDDVLADEEAAPFAPALEASGGKSTSADAGRTISKPEFMDACLKGTFKNINP